MRCRGGEGGGGGGERGGVEAGPLTGAPAAPDTHVGAAGLGHWSHREAAAIQIQAMGSIGHAAQPGKLVVHLLDLTLYLLPYIHYFDA